MIKEEGEVGERGGGERGGREKARKNIKPYPVVHDDGHTRAQSTVEDNAVHAYRRIARSTESKRKKKTRYNSTKFFYP